MRLYVANRGEIAVRILRTAREMGFATSVGYSEADKHALFTREADTAVPLGPPEPARSYLDVDRVLDAARRAGADSIHPGYGFLSENAAFAEAVIAAGFRWVGPPPAAIAAMGDKLGARARMIAAGVPVVPGVESDDVSTIAVLGFPIMLKAAAGGGGRGMREVLDADALAAALADASSEAARAFGDGRMYAERRLVRPRHVEVQVLADVTGHTIHLHERECSIQRRHQKVVEEAPCVVLDAATREAMCEAAIRATAAVGYVGAGTVEFLLAPDGRFFFLEMNTRIQVEHAVTEAITGVDLVREQLRIALGEPIGHDGVEARGHAIECRVYAEDPAGGFVGSSGVLLRHREPTGPGVRVDTGVYEGAEVPVWYDPMIAKVVTWGPHREAARTRMLRALGSYEIAGLPTTLELLRDVVAHPAFVSADLATDFLDRHFAAWAPPADADVALLAALALGGRRGGTVRVEQPTPWATIGRWP